MESLGKLAFDSQLIVHKDRMKFQILYTPYISRISRVGCYSRIQQRAKINLPPILTQECYLCIRNTSSTVHSARANE